MKSYDQLRLAVSRQPADYCEIRLEERRHTGIRWQGPVLESVNHSIVNGGIVRALKNGGWGTVSFNSLHDPSPLLDLAVRQAKLVGDDEGHASHLAEVQPVEDIVPLLTVKDPRSLSLAEKMRVCEEYNRQILAYGAPITSSGVSYMDTYIKKVFINSEGSFIIQERIDVAGSCTAVATRERQTQQQHFGFGSTVDAGVVNGHEDRIRELCENAGALLDAPPVKGGKYTVILDPILAGVFIHEAFGHLSEGDNVYENEELQNLMRLGKAVGSGILSVYDTGLEPGARGYMRYDDEGVPTQKTYLIKDGILVGRLHSRETAGKMGEAPTGNARAVSHVHAPIPRMRTTVIEPRDATFQAMLNDITLGVYAETAYGGQTDGEQFTFTAGRARMIRRGQLAELVRDVTLTGNVFTTLKNIDLIGAELCPHESPGGCGKAGQFPLPVSMWSPHIRIRNVVIGGRS